MNILNKYVFILLFIVSTNSYGQVDLNAINGIWLAVESKPIGPNWISPLDGTILYLEDGHGELSDLKNNHIEQFQYVLENNNIIRDDTIALGKIQSLSAKEMTILVGKSMLTSFRPLKNFNYEIEVKELEKRLIANPWKIISSQQEFRIDFTNDWWSRYKVFKSSMAHYTDGDSKYRESEKWRIMNYQGIYIIGISFEQFELNFYQIINYDDNEIEIISLNPGDESQVEMHKITELSKEQIDNIKVLISSQEWVIDNTEIDLASVGVSLRENHLILKDNFINKELLFQFDQDNHFEIRASDKIVKSGDWTITADGVYLVFDQISSYAQSNYFKLLSMSTDQIILNHTIELKTSGNNYEGYNCVTTLKKRP